MKNNDQYMTVREAMRLYKVCRRTIMYWIQQGKLQSIKIGHSRRILRERGICSSKSTS